MMLNINEHRRIKIDKTSPICSSFSLSSDSRATHSLSMTTPIRYGLILLHRTMNDRKIRSAKISYVPIRSRNGCTTCKCDS